ncbi:glycoside hydrolase family 55 protein [Lyophyllum atratum]|nr:glycoside hydrolase family 55 protein [Lyophyllum atratum]
MLTGILLLFLSFFLYLHTVKATASQVVEVGASLGLDHGAAIAEEPFWLEMIKHQGSSPYNPNMTYQVFRNVKDFGATGDGITDDTEAINLAISSGDRCGGGAKACNSSTYVEGLSGPSQSLNDMSGPGLHQRWFTFPRVSSPIIAYYYTQLIGDAKSPPTLLASANFEGMAVIDADPYIPGGNGAQWYGNTNNLSLSFRTWPTTDITHSFRSVRNFIIDVRRVPSERSQGTGLHWQVAQATSLINIVFEMSTAPGTAHQGIWMENGSGGFMGDLIFNGGKYGMWVGNQQFTVRNVTINNADTAVLHHWNWGGLLLPHYIAKSNLSVEGWTFQGITINKCRIGFDLIQGVSAVAIVDAIVRDTPVFIRSAAASNTTLAGSLVLNNIHFKNVSTVVSDANDVSILPGGSRGVINTWGQGNIYSGTSSMGDFIQGNIPAAHKPSILLDSAGRIFGKKHPQYEDYSIRQFVSAKDHGARGDGSTDDTHAIQTLLYKFGGRKIVFFDAGTYIVTSTITIPAGTRMVGEAWSVIAGKGKAFSDQENPRAVVRVGEKHSCGVVEITDMIFSTVGPAPGAIVVEWNVREPDGRQGATGMWDTHIRLGGASGTELELANCPPGASETEPCMAAFLALHLTHGSSAYLEGSWVWLADHDLDGDGTSQISIYSGRGILSESEGPVWMVGTAEHHVLYQYRLVHAKNHYMGLIQTESVTNSSSRCPYWQPSPPAPHPFSIDCAYKDPNFSAIDTSAWALSIESSKDIIIFGAGLYSFFQNYSQACLNTRDCQPQIVDIDSDSIVHIYSLSTVASTFQVSVDGAGIVNQSDNINGFASTVTVWSPFKYHHHDSQIHVEIEADI